MIILIILKIFLCSSVCVLGFFFDNILLFEVVFFIKWSDRASVSCQDLSRLHCKKCATLGEPQTSASSSTSQAAEVAAEEDFFLQIVEEASPLNTVVIVREIISYSFMLRVLICKKTNIFYFILQF